MCTPRGGEGRRTHSLLVLVSSLKLRKERRRQEARRGMGRRPRQGYTREPQVKSNRPNRTNHVGLHVCDPPLGWVHTCPRLGAVYN